MGEGQRIEGQMFRSAGVRWAVAIFALIIAAGGVLIFGYIVKMWVGAAGGWAAGLGTGGGGALGGGVMVIPPAAPFVPVGQVPWPVPREASVREHWEAQQQGVGTWLAGYWQKNNGRFTQYQSSQAISIPVAGEERFVLVLHVPIGQTPATATEAQIWVCELNNTGAGQYTPSYPAGAMVVASLNEKQVKWMWENGLPKGLAAAMLQQANATAATAGAPVGAWGLNQTEISVEQYFPADDAGEAGGATPDGEEPG